MKFKNLVALCVAATAVGVSALKSVSVTLQTNFGDIKMVLDGVHAPKATENFYELCKRGYYDNTVFFRLTTQGIFVVQGGDPTGTGNGGESIYGQPFPDENLTGAKYTTGTVAMANAGPNTNRSQFFIVFANSELPPSYTVFGHVETGIGTIVKVASAGTEDDGSDGPPRERFVINKCTAEST